MTTLSKPGEIKVDTELLGGDEAAREFFEQKTGTEVPKVVDEYHPVVKDGIEYSYRPMGRSGHPKVDITDSVSVPGTTILEKVTFK